MSKLHDIITTEEAAFRKTFSQKPKRGRPRRFPEAAVAQMPLNRNGTWRGNMNELYRRRVLSILFPDDATDTDYGWIVSHKTVLYELGRVSADLNDDDARALLKKIREADPPMTTRAAVAAIRQWRLGRPPRKSLDDIYGRIVKVLNRYDATDEALDAMHEALEAALHLVDRAKTAILSTRGPEA